MELAGDLTGIGNSLGDLTGGGGGDGELALDLTGRLFSGYPIMNR